MRLFEYQAKQIFKEKGIPVPASILVCDLIDAPRDFLPAVYKAQMLTGGRGKAGAVKVIEKASQINQVYRELMAIKIKNESVHAILVEEKKPIKKEYYLSLVVDKQKGRPVFIASPDGGVDIEQVSRETPERIMQHPVDILLGLQEYEIRRIGKFMQVSETVSLITIMRAMYAIFKEDDATLVEINPLADTGSGLVALDAKVTLDEKASFRQAELFEKIRQEQGSLEPEGLTESERLAKEWDVTYVQLDGDIGIISDGAGTGMLTLDLVRDAGGRAANFCELGGLGDADRMKKGLQVVTANPKINVVLISLIGGITRMDDMANGIAEFLKTTPSPLPIVVRMCGTQEEEGIRILKEWDIPVDDDLAAVVKKAVEVSRSQANDHSD